MAANNYNKTALAPYERHDEPPWVHRVPREVSKTYKINTYINNTFKIVNNKTLWFLWPW